MDTILVGEISEPLIGDSLMEYHQINARIIVTNNGKDCLDYIRENPVDLLLLDVELPEYSALDILYYLNRSSIIKPKIILMCQNTSFSCLSLMQKYHIDDIIIKPTHLSSLLFKIAWIVQCMNKPGYYPAIETIDKSIEDLLHRFGVSSSNKGYHYLKSAVIYYTLHSNNPIKITGELYPVIAKMYNTTPNNIERCIRHAIETAFTRCNPEIIEFVFGYSISYEKAKPTNSEFIITLSQYISKDIYPILQPGNYFLNQTYHSSHIKT